MSQPLSNQAIDALSLLDDEEQAKVLEYIQTLIDEQESDPN